MMVYILVDWRKSHIFGVYTKLKDAASDMHMLNKDKNNDVNIIMRDLIDE